MLFSTPTGAEPQLVFRNASTGPWFAVNDTTMNEILDLSAMPVILSNFNNSGSVDPTNPTFGSINPNDLTLPVSLLAFEGKLQNARVELFWKTSSETNNDGFEVQHSTNGKIWQPIGYVSGHGHSLVTREYAFTHDMPGGGQNYYRLRQIDFDGRSMLSPLISIEMILRNQVDIFPNPSSGVFHLLNEFDRLHAEVFDFAGKRLLSQSVLNRQIDLTGLRPGQYLLKLSSENQIFVQRIGLF